MHGWSAGWDQMVKVDTEIIDYAASNEFVVLWPFAQKIWFVAEAYDTPTPDWDKRHTNKGVQNDAVIKMVRHLIN